MGERVVTSRWVKNVLLKLVRNKVYYLEGNVHAELGGVAAVECTEALVSVDGRDTVEGSSVGGVVHLKPLFHDCVCVCTCVDVWKENV